MWSILIFQSDPKLSLQGRQGLVQSIWNIQPNLNIPHTARLSKVIDQ
uniref:Uncharacterized protein n=1 Tax=Rhizophora mucronata TaxID=61149 RepID=A0A2P2QFB2_RHIMU